MHLALIIQGWVDLKLNYLLWTESDRNWLLSTMYGVQCLMWGLIDKSWFSTINVR